MLEKMALFRQNRVVNWHEHVWFDSEGNLDMNRLEEIVRMARATFTDMLVVSNPMLGFDCPPEAFRHCNDAVLQAVRLYPDLLRGMCFVNPGYAREACAEIERCVDGHGFVGVKLYNHYLISDPAVHPVLDLCRERGLPVLQHACKLNFYAEGQPFASCGEHFAKAAEKYPDVDLIHAHISGGGDWQWALKAIAPYPNIFTDISGSVCDEGIVEETVAYLGANRVLFGTDMSYSACVGKVLAAKITESEKREILNNHRFERYLSEGAGQ